MRCFLCNQSLHISSHGICSQCIKNLNQITLVCRLCGLPHAHKTSTCYRCREKNYPWNELIAVSDYVYPLKKLIHNLKFNQKIELAVPLARLMFLAWYRRRLECAILKPDIITCVPLHRIRHWSRGFNQAEKLAYPISKWIKCHFKPHLLKRIKINHDQKSLSKINRGINVKSVFSCETSLTGKSIMLIDDIVTTGHTIEAVSHILKEKGASNIQIVCLCRTVL